MPNINTVGLDCWMCHNGTPHEIHETEPIDTVVEFHLFAADERTARFLEILRRTDQAIARDAIWCWRSE